MSDAGLVPTTPLAVLNALSMPGLSAAGDLTRHVLRGRPEIHAPAAEALGFTLPVEACRAAGAGGRHALWLGPDEWLLLGPPGDRLDRALAVAAGDAAYSLVEVTHRQVGLVLDRRDAAAILAVGCPLDLDIAAFPVGMCTRTLFAKADVVLWRTGENAFHIEVWRSFADYLCRYLAQAGAEFA